MLCGLRANAILLQVILKKIDLQYTQRIPFKLNATIMPEFCCQPKICPFCGDSLLRHLGSSGLYWYCPGCRHAAPHFHAEATRNSILK